MTVINDSDSKWEAFLKTGSIESYLEYRSAKQSETQNKRDHS